MKRSSLKRMIVFLLLGAIVNVAVALYCVQSRRESYLNLEVEWQSNVPKHWPDRPDRADGWCSLGRTFTRSYARRLAWIDRDRATEQYFEECVAIVGFPMLCLAGSTLMEESGFGTTSVLVSTDTFDAIDISSWRLPNNTILPHRVLWPGFLINTILYGAVLWVLFIASNALRRRRRIKRGLCPACAYPVGASRVCTECGKPVKPSAISGQQSAELQA